MKINVVIALALSAGLSLCALYPSGNSAAHGEPAEVSGQPAQSLERLPVKEVTVFKDGHALVVRAGSVNVDNSGEVCLEDLPKPLLGTFFPFGESETLQSVKVGPVKKQYSQTALSYEELLRANPGAEVTIGRQSADGKATAMHQGTLASTPVPVRNLDEQKELKKFDTTGDAVNLTNDAGARPALSNLVQIEEAGGGSTFVPIAEINRLSFKSTHNPRVKNETLVDALTLRFDKQRSRQVKAGVMYVQAGMRWLPSYKVTLGNVGKAHLKMEATIVNDLIDLDDTTVQLVVGVPTFAARGQLDPIALSKTLGDVAAHLSSDSYLSNSRSNAIQITSQRMSANEDDSTAGGGGANVDLSGAKHEDLFVFSLKHVSLKRGERLVVPVMENDVDYEDLYTLDMPVKPPGEVMASSSRPSTREGEGDLKVLHKIRLKNNDSRPFTTAPALVLDGTKNENGSETPIAQSLLTYAPKGASSDLTLTEAIDVKATMKENEVAREDGARSWLGNNYARINLVGNVIVTNYGDKQIKLEIKRTVLGQVDGNSPNGKAEMLNSTGLSENSGWWYSYSWPAWWAEMNGLGRFTFKEEIAAHQKAEASYKWHYFWR